MTATRRISTLSRLMAALQGFAEKVAWFVSMLLFAILYVIAFAPLALFMKLRGRRFLPMFDGSEKTCFFPKEKIKPGMEFLKRQW